MLPNKNMPNFFIVLVTLDDNLSRIITFLCKLFYAKGTIILSMGLILDIEFFLMIILTFKVIKYE
jgi:hypothetical protein